MLIISLFVKYVNQHDFHLTKEQQEKFEAAETLLTLSNASIDIYNRMLLVESNGFSYFVQRFSSYVNFHLFISEKKSKLKEISDCDLIKILNIVIEHAIQN